MIDDKKIVVVLPAFNAESTLEKTFREIPDIVDDVILTDDCSSDQTAELAKLLGIQHVISHNSNMGYGANQKTCYKKALELDADIILMLHPDYQYTPKLIPSMVYLIANDIYDVVLGSRILSKGALKGGMPLYKYISNRVLTFFQNLLLNHKLSEYHTGYRCYKSEVFRKIPFEENSNNFVFDNELLAQLVFHKYSIGEVSCPTVYDEDSSSISFSRSITYGLGVLRVSFQFLFTKIKIAKSSLFVSR